MSGGQVPSPRISEQEILDFAARIGVQAKRERVAKSQFEQIIASLESSEDEKVCLLVTTLFVFRQASRMRFENTAKEIGRALSYLYDRNGTKQDARKLLGLAKWAFECADKWGLDRAKDFGDFLRQILGRGHV